MKSKIRWLLIALLAICVFSTTYVIKTTAGVVYNRCYNTYNDGCGYFTQQLGSCPLLGNVEDVFPNGIPVNTTVDDTSFIDSIEVPLRTGTQQERTGAAFIIQLMRGVANVGNNPRPSAADITDWEGRVRYAWQQGRIRFKQNVTYDLNSCYQGGDPPNGKPAHDDDMFWSETASGYSQQTQLGIQFYGATGHVAFMILYSCANPVGVIQALPSPPPPPTYTITANTNVTPPNAFPGQTVTFRHYLNNSGPSIPNINWSTWQTTNGGALTGENAGTYVGLGVGNHITSTENYTIPLNAGNGTKICRYINFNPAVNGAGSGTDAPGACVTVVYNFTLTPTVVANKATANQGDSIQFTYSVTNNGPTESLAFSCKVAGQTFPPVHNPLPQQNADRNPAILPQPAFTNCTQIPKSTVQVAVENFPVGNTPVGDSICRSLVVNPYGQLPGETFRSSAETCVVIAKGPYVHMMGNDVWAGGDQITSFPICNTVSKIQGLSLQLPSGAWAGSGSQYASYATGKIDTFGTGNQALETPVGPAGTLLTFTNNNLAALGFFTPPQHCIDDYYSTFVKAVKDPVPAGNAYNVGAPAAYSTTIKDVATNNVISFSGNPQKGSKQVYMIEGNGGIVISGDIKYPANYASVNDIPTLTIISRRPVGAGVGGTITVSRNVQQMDGLYVADFKLFTCDVALGTVLSVKPPCEKQLTINGPAKAGTFELLRTYGADAANPPFNDQARQAPAESFDFSPEIYLDNAFSASSTSTIRTVNEIDLPPRY